MPLAGAVYTKKKQLYKEEVVIRKKDSYTEERQLYGEKTEGEDI